MVTIITRAQIGLRPRSGGGTSLPLDAENVAYHWPGMAKAIDAVGDAGFRRVCSALRGWQTYHMDVRGWSDIAYQMAIDQEGRIYTLRGINIQSGANGDGPTNRKYGAILLVLGPGEQMTAKMKAACRALGALYRQRFKRMPRRPTWHGAIRPTGGTDCPGQEAISEIKAGSLDAGTTPIAEESMALTNEDKAWFESRIQAYALYITENRRQTMDDQAAAVWAQTIDTTSAAGMLIQIRDDVDDAAAATQRAAIHVTSTRVDVPAVPAEISHLISPLGEENPVQPDGSQLP